MGQGRTPAFRVRQTACPPLRMIGAPVGDRSTHWTAARQSGSETPRASRSATCQGMNVTDGRTHRCAHTTQAAQNEQSPSTMSAGRSLTLS